MKATMVNVKDFGVKADIPPTVKYVFLRIANTSIHGGRIYIGEPLNIIFTKSDFHNTDIFIDLTAFGERIFFECVFKNCRFHPENSYFNVCDKSVRVDIPLDE